LLASFARGAKPRKSQLISDNDSRNINYPQEDPMKLADSIVAELDNEAQTTKRLLERLPDEKLSWKPHAKSFSLGQLALHIAAVPGSIAAAVTKDTMEAPDFAQAEAKSRNEVIETFTKSMSAAMATVKSMDDARLNSTWSLTKNGKTILSMPRVAVVRNIMMNHIYHHRGQLSVYLRMLEVPLPSIYGPSADENPFA
jgi:uncharacterized damage-inducible protein DinB